MLELTGHDRRVLSVNEPAQITTGLAASADHELIQEDTVPVSADYRAPGWLARNLGNRFVAFMARRGVSMMGSRILAVRGRSTGQWRTTPVNLLELGGRRYLVSPRGETQWVRNLRAAGSGELRLGRRAEAFTGRELASAAKVPVLRAYLKRWKFEVGVFFDGVGPDSRDDELLAIADRHPAFELSAPS